MMLYTHVKAPLARAIYNDTIWASLKLTLGSTTTKTMQGNSLQHKFIISKVGYSKIKYNFFKKIILVKWLILWGGLVVKSIFWVCFSTLIQLKRDLHR